MLVVLRDIDEARDEQRLAQALATVLGPRARRAEPAEPAVVTVVRGEPAVRTVLLRDVNAASRERARQLVRPRAAELRGDRVEQRLLVDRRSPDLVPAALRRRGELVRSFA